MHPRFTQIMSRALGAGLDVEVYSNLVHVTDEMWELFQSPRVSLAFSYFARDATAHNAVTGRPSHKATRRNAEKAAALGIPIRAGVIDFGHVREAVSDLKAIGVTKVATDRVRRIGRGGDGTPAPAELCGRCGHNVAAVSADGDVSPCIFTRWLKVGNVRQTPLADILASPAMTTALTTIPRRADRACDPDDPDDDPCSPDKETECPPASCSPRN
jgi:MoaA/NifB/PqqE/SkfB family radical SAM enzyme